MSFLTVLTLNNICIIPPNLGDYYCQYLQYTIMLCCCVLSVVHNICLPVHVHILPLLFLEVTSSTLEMTSSVDGPPVGVIWVDPWHDHVIVAAGFPPCMVHVRVTLLPSIIGPTGICVSVGNVVGWSKIGWHSDLQYFHYLRNVLWISFCWSSKMQFCLSKLSIVNDILLINSDS
jgi:hypothetical protein